MLLALWMFRGFPLVVELLGKILKLITDINGGSEKLTAIFEAIMKFLSGRAAA